MILLCKLKKNPSFLPVGYQQKFLMKKESKQAPGYVYSMEKTRAPHETVQLTSVR